MINIRENSVIKIVALFLLAASVGLYGENPVKDKTVKNNVENWDNARPSDLRSQSGKKCFSMVKPAITVSKEFIPVDSNSSYVLAGWFRCSGHPQVKCLLFGFIPYDKNKNQILPEYVNIVPKTETELFEDCFAEDTIIKVKDASKWLSDNQYSFAIAFEVDNSGKYSDLPNSNVTLPGIDAVTKKGDYWEVKLKKMCGQNFIKGTKIREHRTDNTYIYPVIAQKIPEKWIKYSGKIHHSPQFGSPSQQWWPGTKYAKILILPVKGKVDFDNIQIRKL